MTNQEILTKAIQKAIDNGWRGDLLDIKLESQEDGLVRVYWDNTEWSVLDVIYNHAFAKALWGDRFINPELRDDKSSRVVAIQQTAWKHHLRQMVIADNPVQYLGDNLLADNKEEI